MKKGLWAILCIMALVACSGGGSPFANLLAESFEEEDGNKMLSFCQRYGKAFSMKDMRQSFVKRDSLMAVYCSAEPYKDTMDDRMRSKVRTVVLKVETKNHKIDKVTDLIPSH